MKIGSLKVDSARASAGAWVKDLPQGDDIELLVRGFTYEPYAAAVSLAVSKVGPEGRREGRPDGAILPHVQDKITGRAMAEHLVLDWRNINDDAGQPIPFDIEKALLWLTHPDYRPFNALASMACQEVERIGSTRVKAVEGNSSHASGITSVGANTPPS